MRLAAFALGLAALVAAPLPGAADGLPAGWTAALAGGEAVKVTAKPVAVTPDSLDHVTLRGAWVLTADSSDFGGLSGLIVRDGRLYAAADVGWWFGAKMSELGMSETGGGPTFTDARLAPMHDAWGLGYSKTEGDAEGLAWDRGGLAVSLERDHRILWLGAKGQMARPLRLPGFRTLENNKGLEALASLPGGRLLAISEQIADGAARMFVIGPDGKGAESRLPLKGPESVTGADLGPDGWLYVVRRYYGFLVGLKIKVMRFRLDRRGFPDPETAQTLASFGPDSGIDNMEGIATDPRPDGRLRLWLISDDNFNPFQRTLLVSFDVTP